ncbi:MAG: amino acid adenylation domain-containing protein [Nostoc sp.]|uniref:non-ribosomal peptide synthetase n=1 Tax=Nostoc sp. TaxID=1180 RepID=UPI002FEEDDA8
MNKNMLISRQLFSQKIYWLNKLSPELPETNLMLDYVRTTVDNGKNKFLKFDLSNCLSQAIVTLTKGSEFSIFLILLSALNILLQKYTRNNDIIVGIPIYQKSGIDGLGNKVIPLRTQVTNQLTFKDFLFQVKDATIAAYSHQNYDFDELIQLLNLSQSWNRCPIFDIVVSLENIHDLHDLSALNNDITLSFLVKENSISGKIEYSNLIFKDETIISIINYYQNVMECIVNNIDTKISDIVLLRDSEKCQLLIDFNNNFQEYPVEHSINKLFEIQVEKTPNNIAVIDQETQLTYQELNEKANQLAILLRNLEVTPGEFIGILKDRDINFLVAILAIYKAGGAYVPIDSTYPPSRIQYMLSNSEVRFILTDCYLLNGLTYLIEDCPQLKYIICLDKVNSDNILIETKKLKIYDQLSVSKLPKENIEQLNDGSDPAYMLYTSGSTGLPKGAIVRHDGAINHIYAQYDELELTPEFCFLQSAPSSTDISVWQFIAPLLIGGKTVIVDIETVAFPEKLFKVLKKEKITVVELVPALFKGLLDYTSQLSSHERILPDLRWMMVVGEPVSVKWVNEWLSIYPSIRIANAYGPTEAADDITQFIVDKPLPENQRTVPIGKPLANLNIYILDQEMQIVPIGVPGEICVSGIGVGNGYWKNEEKTNFSFVPNPFPSHTKPSLGNHRDLIYKTGDLGRWLADGNIEFLGRIDHQIKIRGFRIELGEIEALLGKHPAVRETVVITHKQEEGNLQLVAYVVAKTELAPTISELRSFLQQKLPDYMLPSAFVNLKTLPLAPSGKIDRHALPAPDTFKNKHPLNFVPPRTQTEALVADIWTQILKVKQVGIHDNFFDLGGHSLLATQIISRLQEAFEVKLSLRSLFEEPTVAQFVEHIEKIRTVQQLQTATFDTTGDREEIEL